MSKESGILRIAGIVRESIVDGPGIRFAVFCQGCPHRCEGCHNLKTLDFEGGYDCTTDKIMVEVDKNPLLAGVTFSGGEPFCQPEGFLDLAKKVKQRKLDIVAFSGYTYEELLALGQTNPVILELLQHIDILVDGKFILAEKDLTLQFRGSRNQRVIDMNRTRESHKIIEYHDI